MFVINCLTNVLSTPFYVKIACPSIYVRLYLWLQIYKKVVYASRTVQLYTFSKIESICYSIKW